MYMCVCVSVCMIHDACMYVCVHTNLSATQLDTLKLGWCRVGPAGIEA